MISSLLHFVGLRPRVYYTLTNNTPMTIYELDKKPKFIILVAVFSQVFFEGTDNMQLNP